MTTVIQIFGLVMIAFALFCFYKTLNRTKVGWIRTVLVVIILVGAALLFHNRVTEMKVLGIASITAAQEKAETGTREIENLKDLAVKASKQTLTLAFQTSNDFAVVRRQISTMTNQIVTAEGELKHLQSDARADAQEISAIRQRMEIQATTMNSVTQELAVAKTVLNELRKENEKATLKLQEMDTYTASIGLIPDGRLLLGGNLTGRAWILERGITNLATLFSAGKYKEAYEAAKDYVRRHEESAEAEKRAATRSGDVYMTADGLAQIYTFGAQSAQRVNDNDAALDWSRKAVALKPNAETKILLVASLLNMHSSALTDEAQSLIKTTLGKGDDEAAQFKNLLSVYGILKKE